MNLIDRLIAASDSINPAVEMSQDIARMVAGGLLDEQAIDQLMPSIAEAANKGERDLDVASTARRSLDGAAAVAAKDVPFGF